MTGENVAERLKLFIESKGLTYSQFADSCGIPRPSLSQLLTGRNKKINDTMVRQIHNEFPDLSVVWLLFGEGPMEASSSLASKENDSSGVDMGLFGSIYAENENLTVSGEPKNQKSLLEGQNGGKFPKESGLNDPQNIAYQAERQNDILKLKIKELTSEIEKLRKNPRKVAQITLYYDDSTFETFVPFSKE